MKGLLIVALAVIILTAIALLLDAVEFFGNKINPSKLPRLISVTIFTIGGIIMCLYIILTLIHHA